MRDDDPGLREKLRELANQNRRFGYRLLQILQRREGVMTDLRAQGGRAGVKSATQPRACSRAQDAGCGSCPAESAVELGLRSRSDGVRLTVLRARHRGSRHSRVLGGGVGHPHVGPQCRT
jgi:hypothetical protein